MKWFGTAGTEAGENVKGQKRRRQIKLVVALASMFVVGVLVSTALADSGSSNGTTTSSDSTPAATTTASTTTSTDTTSTDTTATDTTSTDTTATTTTSTTPSSPPVAPAAAVTLATDKPTYVPGDSVAVSGANWLPGESVHVHAADSGGHGWSYDADVLAGADGTIGASFALPTSFAGDFAAVATGALTESASASFSDAFAPVAGTPTIISDQADYAPGSTVMLTGTGWQPTEAVHIFVNDDQGQTWSYAADVTADSKGAFATQLQLPTSFVAVYSVVATGPQSGTTRTSFTDGNFTLGIASTDTVTPPSWSVDYQTYGTGSNADTTCSGAVVSSGTLSAPGGNIAIGSKESAKPTTVHPGSGYTFAYWSDSATSTTPDTSLCRAGGSGTVGALYAHFRNAVQSTSLSIASATGTYGGSANLSATLTAGGSAVSGKTVSFTLNGSSVGSGSTDSSGVATKSTVSLAGISVGTYSTAVGASFAGDSSYSTSSGTGSLTVSKATLTVTAPSPIITYGQAVPSLAPGYSGFVGSDTASSLTTQPTCSTGSVTGAGSYPVTCSGGVSSNYSFSYVAGTLTVTKATLTVTAPSPTITYGQSVPALAPGYSGFVGSDTASSLTTQPTCSTGSVTGAGSYPVTCSGGVSSNYSFSYVAGTLTVNKAALTVTGPSPTITYGQSVPALAPGYSGFVGSDTASSLTTQPTCSAGSVAGAGSYTVSCSGGVATNYSFNYVNGTLTVNKAALTIAVADKSKVYGDANPALTGAISGVKNGDVISAAYSTAATAASGVGAYAITAAAVGTPASVLANYNVTVNDGTLTITKRTLSISAADKSKLYGAANPTFTGSISGVQNADAVSLSFSSLADASSGVGSYAIVPHADATDAVLANYSVDASNGTLTVTKRTLTIAAADKSKLYGAANPTFTGSISGIQNSDAITESFSTAASAASGVGDYAIVPHADATDAVLANYTVDATNGTLTVTKRTLTISAADKSKLYGADNPTFTGSISGVQNGDGVSLSFSSAANASSGVGDYAIVPHADATDAVMANYTVDASNGTLTVTKRTLAISAADKSKLYGAANPTFTGSISGIQNGDGVSLSFSSAANASSGVGDYAIVPHADATDAVLANYSVDASNGTLTISKRTLTIAAADKSKLYGADNPTFTGSISGVQNADAVSLSFSTVANASSDVGDYAIVPHADATDAVLANYSVDASNGTLTVTKRTLSISAADKSKLYGADNPTFTGSISGIQNGDPITESFSTAANASSGVGDYAIVPHTDATDAVLANYTVDASNGTLTVTKRTLSIAAADKSKLYGAANPTFTGSISGVQNADAVTESFSTGATAASGVGAYAILPHADATDAVLANYSVDASNGTLTITKRTLTISAADKSKLYGAANPTFTGSISGIQNGDAVTESFSTSATAASGVGDYAIVPHADATDAALANYSVDASNGTLTITKRTLTISAADKSKVYGDANPALTGGIYGIQNGDAITESFSTAATAASGAGDYAIAPHADATDAVLANYTVDATNGTLTVTKAPLSAKANDASKVYGQANPGLSGSLTGVQNGDAITESFSTAANTASGVGSYAIVPQVNAAPAVLANYQTPVLTNGTLTITKAPLSAKANDATKILNAPNPTFTGGIYGIQNGDAITESFSTAATQSSPIGTYAIVPQVSASAAVLANYQTPALTNGTLSILYATGTCLGSAGRAILQPINTDGTSVFKQGSTVPAKFRACDTNSASVGPTTAAPNVVSSFKLIQRVNGTAINAVNESVDSTTPDTAFRWDSTAQQWIYNISTKPLTANTTYVYVITLNDGSTIQFQFGLK
jgi:hypothetical protein